MYISPYQISADDVERSSTLEPADVGHWALSINGAVHFFDSYQDASETATALNKDNALAFIEAHSRSTQKWKNSL